MCSPVGKTLAARGTVFGTVRISLLDGVKGKSQRGLVIIKK